jgi:hypothetical protein
MYTKIIEEIENQKTFVTQQLPQIVAESEQSIQFMSNKILQYEKRLNKNPQAAEKIEKYKKNLEKVEVANNENSFKILFTYDFDNRIEELRNYQKLDELTSLKKQRQEYKNEIDDIDQKLGMITDDKELQEQMLRINEVHQQILNIEDQIEEIETQIKPVKVKITEFKETLNNEIKSCQNGINKAQTADNLNQQIKNIIQKNVDKKQKGRKEKGDIDLSTSSSTDFPSSDEEKVNDNKIKKEQVASKNIKSTLNHTELSNQQVIALAQSSLKQIKNNIGDIKKFTKEQEIKLNKIEQKLNKNPKEEQKNKYIIEKTFVSNSLAKMQTAHQQLEENYVKIKNDLSKIEKNYDFDKNINELKSITQVMEKDNVNDNLKSNLIKSHNNTHELIKDSKQILNENKKDLSTRITSSSLVKALQKISLKKSHESADKGAINLGKLEKNQNKGRG